MSHIFYERSRFSKVHVNPAPWPALSNPMHLLDLLHLRGCIHTEPLLSDKVLVCSPSSTSFLDSQEEEKGSLGSAPPNPPPSIMKGAHFSPFSLAEEMKTIAKQKIVYLLF